MKITATHPEWSKEARTARGELCQRCGGFNWQQDRDGERPQLCLRCRYKDLLARADASDEQADTTAEDSQPAHELVCAVF